MSNKLTEQEKAVLSNGICGDEDTVKSLKEKGFVFNLFEDNDNKFTEDDDYLLFFQLTNKGESYRQKNFQIDEKES